MTQRRTPISSAEKPQTRTVVAKRKFLQCFATHGIVLHACQQAGIGRRIVYKWLEKDTRFAALYAEAQEDAIDLLEAEARRRAVEGWVEPVYQKGGKVGEVRKFSDTLLVLKLKAKKPEYRDKYEVTGNMTVSPSEAVNLLAEGRKRAAEAAK
jgi:hypothetical protein